MHLRHDREPRTARLFAPALLLLAAAVACATPQRAAEDARPAGTADEQAASAETSRAQAGADSAAAAPEPNERLRVTTGWLADHLDVPEVVVVHVGPDRSRYDAGHIPGAVFLPLSAYLVDREGLPNQIPPIDEVTSALEAAGISDDSRVVVYGDRMGLWAARLVFTLAYLGHENASLLDGGLERWRSEGRPVSEEAVEPEPGRLTASPERYLVVDADWVRDHLETPEVVLLDARPPEQYRGERPGKGVARAGRIPGAHNVFWETSLMSPEDPVLRDLEVLRQRFVEAGVDPGDVVVTYCRTGGMASHLWWVSRLLGYETRLYDGSYVDWAAREDLPVEP